MLHTSFTHGLHKVEAGQAGFAGSFDEFAATDGGEVVPEWYPDALEQLCECSGIALR